ncbi:NAC domain containing protein 50 [Linum perenne]
MIIDADTAEAYIASLNLTSGVRFRPTLEELVGHFLFGKIRGDSDDDRIKEVDIYAKEPWVIWEEFSENSQSSEDLYFYTKLKSVSKRQGKSSKIDRRIAEGKGNWHGDTKGFPIHMNYYRIGNKVPELIKFEKKKFTYRNFENVKQHGSWIMDEYRCVEKTMNGEMVLCRLRRNSSKKVNARNKVDLSSSSLIVPCSSSGGSNITTEDEERDPKRRKIDRFKMAEVAAVLVQLALPTTTAETEGGASTSSGDDDDDLGMWDGLGDLECPDYLEF